MAGRPRAVFSGYGYLFFFLGTVITVILARGAKAAFVLLAVLLFASLVHAPALRLFSRWQLWAFVAPTLLISPLVIGEPDLLVGGLQLSVEGFWAGLWMAVRALSIALAAAIVAGTVSVSEMAQLFEGMRLKGLGFAVGVATNMLPTIRETMETSYLSIRLRGGFRSHRLRSLRLLLVAVIAGSLRRGDDIVSAAEARAFDPTRSTQPSVSVTRGDIALATVIVVLALVLLLA
ncbi:MAG TPA: energy-coupling factor transporter transmembrane component T [Anaerolineae bacterium]|nr:energy-coupling factor transporter transmembrane component T [Anaerolineae bacterium]